MVGRPVEPAGIERTVWPERPQPVHRRDAAAQKEARSARLAAEVTVRVRCTDIQLHRIRLSGGRLQLLDHSRSDRDGWYVGELPRCLAVLQVWRAAGQPGYGHLVRGSAGPDRWKIHDGTLPQALRRAREQTITDGLLRADHRSCLCMPALAANNAAGALVARLLLREYGRLARPRLLLDRPMAAPRVNALPSHGPARAHGVAFRDPDADTGEDRGGYLSVHIRHDWLRTLWWQGLGLVDGRTVLDVNRDQLTGQVQAWLLDWAAPDWRSNSTDTTTVPGELGVLAVPLILNGGRWHLSDPGAGATLRPVPARR